MAGRWCWDVDLVKMGWPQCFLAFGPPQHCSMTLHGCRCQTECRHLLRQSSIPYLPGCSLSWSLDLAQSWATKISCSVRSSSVPCLLEVFFFFILNVSIMTAMSVWCMPSFSANAWSTGILVKSAWSSKQLGLLTIRSVLRMQFSCFDDL